MQKVGIQYKNFVRFRQTKPPLVFMPVRTFIYQATWAKLKKKAILLEAWLPLCSNTTNNFSRHEMSSILSHHIALPPSSLNKKQSRIIRLLNYGFGHRIMCYIGMS